MSDERVQFTITTAGNAAEELARVTGRLAASEHSMDVGEYTDGAGGTYFQATCRCGWAGDKHAREAGYDALPAHRAAADRDGDGHLAALASPVTAEDGNR